jgi:hypothetical protein
MTTVVTPAATPVSTPAASAPSPDAKGAEVVKPKAATPPVTAAPTPEAKPEPPKPPSKLKFAGKVDGAEKQWELTPEEVVTRLQKSEASEKRMQEAAGVRKQWDQIRELAKTNPELVLKELAGIEDADAWAEQRVEKKWKKELMPEHERQMLELQQRAETAERRAKEIETAQQAEFQKQQDAKLEAQMESEFKRAFELTSLPWDPEHLELFGQIALDAIDYGIQLTPEQMAAEVKSRLDTKAKATEDKLRSQFTGLKGEDLLSWLGEDGVKEVLRAAVAKHEQSQTAPVAPAPSTSVESPESPRKYKTMADWRKHMRGV